MREMLWYAVGSVGRWLYELADRKLEDGVHDVVRHAAVRFGTVKERKEWHVTA